MKTKRSVKIAGLITAIVFLLLAVAYLTVQSGVFSSAPVVSSKADNCYDETLRIITDCDYMPYSFYTDEGFISGHDVDLIALLANEMHMNLELEFAPWNIGIRSAVKGKNDILMTCDYSDSFEGTDQLIMTEPVSSDEFVVFTRSKEVTSLDKLFSTSIAVMDNGNALQNISMLNLLDHCVRFKDNREALRALENDEVDCAIMRYTVGLALLKELGYTDITSTMSIWSSFLCFGVSKHNQELTDRVNRAIETLRHNGVLEKLNKKWLTTFIHRYTVTELLTSNSWIVAVFVFLVIIILFLVIRNERNKLKEEEETRKEQIARMTGGVYACIVNTDTGKFQIISQNDYFAGKYNSESESGSELDSKSGLKPGSKSGSKMGLKSGLKPVLGSDEDFDVFMKKYIENDVWEQDRNMVAGRISVSSAARELETENEYSVRFRDISSGRPRWYEMRAVRLSDREILYGLADKDSDIINEMISGTAEQTYFSIMYVNLDADLCQIMKKPDWFMDAVIAEAIPYSRAITEFAMRYDGETREFYERISNIDYLRQVFADIDVSYHVYKEHILDKDKWINVTCFVLGRHEDGMPSLLALGFAFLDDEAAEKEEAKLKLAETTERLARENHHNAILNQIIKAGPWTYHIDSNDTVTEADYSPACLAIVQLDTVDSGSEWKQHIHPEDIENVRTAFYACIRDHSCATPYDVEYRFMTGAGDGDGDRAGDRAGDRTGDGGREYRWIHSAGRMRRNPDGTGEFYGICVDIHESVTKREKELQLLKKAEESQKLIDNIAASYGVAFTVNMQDDSCEILRTDSTMPGYDENFETFSQVREFLLSLIPESDREQMLRNLSYDTIRTRLGNTQSYDIKYRRLYKGETTWQIMNITAINSQEFAVGFADRDMEILKEYLEEKRYNEYFALFEADLDTQMLRVIKNERDYDEVAVGCSVPYSAFLQKFASYLEDEPKAFFMQLADPAYVRYELAQDDKLTFSYKSSRLESHKWVDVTSYVILRHEDGTPAMFTIGFSMVDALATARKELLNKLNVDMHMIGGLASGYETLYYVNIDEGTFNIYALDGDKYPETQKMVSMSKKEDEDAFAILRKFGTSELVHPDDRALFAVLSPEFFRERLADSKRFTVRYRRKKDDGYLWNEMDVIKYENVDETANAIAVGFADRDAEIRREQEQQEQIAAYNRIIGALAENFSCVTYVRILDNPDSMDGELNARARSVRTSDLMRRILPEWEGEEEEEEETGFSGKLDLLLEHIVYAPDREQFYADTRQDVIIEKLHHSNTCVINTRFLIDDEIFYYQVQINAVRDNGKLLGFVFGIHSVDEQMKKEKEIQEQLRAAYSRVKDANLRDELLHDILKSGKWSFDISAEDTVLKAHYSRELLALLDADFPEEAMGWTELLYPDDKDKVVDAFMASVRDHSCRTPFDITYRVTDRNGKIIWYHSAGRMIRHEDETGEFFGMHLDITEQIERERQQLALSDGLAREYHTVWLLDGFGRHYMHLFRSTGVKTIRSAVQIALDDPCYDDCITKYVRQYVHEDDQERVLEETKWETIVRETPEVGTYVVSYRRYNPDHTDYDYHQMCYARAAASDGTVNYIFAYRDADKMLREQIAQQQQLAEALSMAESANRAKTTFLNSMSHDIRTPMNAIIGFTSLAERHMDNREQVQDYLRKIAQSSNHLLSLINDVLDLSRIESGKMNLDEKPENLPDIIQTLQDIVQADIKARRHTLLIDTVNVNDENIICDRLRLNQVLLNILSNSIKYTEPGGMISMCITEKLLKQTGYAEYEFCIKDNGMGMDEEYLKTIFDPFTRVRSSTVSRIQGTGLGMTITRNIVDMMGGKIDVKSAPGKGTEMTVTLNFRLQEVHRESASIDELRGLRALIVDDDANNCVSIEKMLQEIGMQTQWRTSAKEAVLLTENACSEGKPYKVYIIDHLMHDMNGIETARRIRKIPGHTSAPVIILTAYDWTGMEKEAYEAGVTEFITRPVFPSNLKRVLNRSLGKAEEQSETVSPTYDFTGKKILLVEDNEMNREIACEILEEDGFVIDTAEDGDIAVEILKKAKPGDYDIVLMDVQMPNMDGYEATRQIRAMSSEIAHIPILAMTANAFEEDRRAALAAGMDEHIAKPINVEKLKQMLEKFL